MEKVKKTLALEDILQAIQYLSDQQRQILKVRLRKCDHRKDRAKRALSETFGLWKHRKEPLFIALP